MYPNRLISNIIEINNSLFKLTQQLPKYLNIQKFKAVEMLDYLHNLNIYKFLFFLLDEHSVAQSKIMGFNHNKSDTRD